MGRSGDERRGGEDEAEKAWQSADSAYPKSQQRIIERETINVLA